MVRPNNREAEALGLVKNSTQPTDYGQEETTDQPSFARAAGSLKGAAEFKLLRRTGKIAR